MIMNQKFSQKSHKDPWFNEVKSLDLEINNKKFEDQMIRELSKQDPQLKCMSSKVCVSQ